MRACENHDDFNHPHIRSSLNLVVPLSGIGFKPER